MGMPGDFELLIIIIAVVLFVWDIIWKLIAMWKAAKRSQRGWFICLGTLSTAGILPIIYLLIYKDTPDYKG